MNDCIRLPRSALTDEIWRSENLARLILYLMARADENGEIKTNMPEIARNLTLSRQQVRTLMKKIESNQILTKSSTTKTTKLKFEFQEVKPKRQPRKQPNQQPNGNQIKTIVPDYVSPPFVAEEYREVWQMWIEYRKEINNNYKSEKSEKIGYEQMVKKSGDNPEVAKQMIEDSIASGYKGMFAPKTNNNAQRNNYPQNRVNSPRTTEERVADYQGLAGAVLRRVKARENQ